MIFRILAGTELKEFSCNPSGYIRLLGKIGDNFHVRWIGYKGGHLALTNCAAMQQLDAPRTRFYPACSTITFGWLIVLIGMYWSHSKLLSDLETAPAQVCGTLVDIQVKYYHGSCQQWLQYLKKPITIRFIESFPPYKPIAKSQKKTGCVTISTACHYFVQLVLFLTFFQVY